MTQRGVSSAAVLDSVACAVKLVVDEALTTDGSIRGDEARANSVLIDHILREEDGGPGWRSLWLVINGFEYDGSTAEQKKKALIGINDLRNGIASLKAGEAAVVETRTVGHYLYRKNQSASDSMSRYSPDQRIDDETRAALPPVMAAIMRVVRSDEDVMFAETGVTYDSLRAYATGNKFPTADRLDALLEWLKEVGIEIDLAAQHVTIDLKKYARKIAAARRGR